MSEVHEKMAIQLYEEMFYKIPSEKFKTKEHDKLAVECAGIAMKWVINAVQECSVVAGYPLDDYKEVQKEIKKIL